MRISSLFVLLIAILLFPPLAEAQSGEVVEFTPLELVHTMNLGASSQILVQKNFLYSRSGKVISIYDIGNRTDPQLVSSITLPVQTTRDMYLENSKLVVSAQTDGLLILDVSDKQTPVIMAQYSAESITTEPGSSIEQVALNGQLLFFTHFWRQNNHIYTFSAVNKLDIRTINTPWVIDSIPTLTYDNCGASQACYVDQPRLPYDLSIDKGLLLVSLPKGRYPSEHWLFPVQTTDNSLIPLDSLIGGLKSDFDQGYIYTTTPSYWYRGSATRPKMAIYAYETGIVTPITGYTDCTYGGGSASDSFPCFLTYGSEAPLSLTDIEVRNNIGYVLSNSGLRVYSLPPDNGHQIFPDDPAILATYPELNGHSIESDNAYLYIFDGSTVQVIRYVSAVTPPQDQVSLLVTQESSRTTIPPGGAHIAYEVSLTNVSPETTWMYPIQIKSLNTNAGGQLAPFADLWEHDCYYWLPTLWPGNSWQCHYGRIITPANGAPTAGTTLTVNGFPSGTESITTAYTVVEGPGVGDLDWWRTNPDIVYGDGAQYIDGDGDGTYETWGYLIGDTNFNGRCDPYEVWWTQKCLLVSADTAYHFLWQSDSEDNRYTLLRELTSAWFNMRAGNDYLCADIDTAANLALLWLYDHAPEGNPNEGGTPVSGVDWDAFSWNYSWLRWYNTTGGDNCAIDIDTGNRSISLSEAVTKVPDSRVVTEYELRDSVSELMLRNSDVRDAMLALYSRIETEIENREIVSAELINQADDTRRLLLSHASPTLQTSLNARWGELDIAQYEGQDINTVWTAINKDLRVPTAVSVDNINTTVTSTLLLLGLWSACLSLLTLLVKRQQ